MSKPKRHHYISKMQLRHFTDEKGHLHFFDKRFPQKGVLASNPTRLFAERDLYTQRGKDGGKDVSVEFLLSDLESRVKPIIEKITDSARKGKSPQLKKEEKMLWDNFFYYQWKRVPDVHNKTMNETEFRVLIGNLLKRYESNFRTITDEERARLSDSNELAKLRKDARARATAIPGIEAVHVLGNRGLAIGVIRNPKKSFVIGSNPVVKLTNPGRSHLADHSVEAWLPLAHDVIISPGLFPGTEKLIEIEKNSDIRQLNEVIFRQSTTIAGRSSALIASLARAS